MISNYNLFFEMLNDMLYSLESILKYVNVPKHKESNYDIIDCTVLSIISKNEYTVTLSSG
jgi:hypothetical protein